MARVSKEEMIVGAGEADRIIRRCENQSGEDCAQAVLMPDDIRALRAFMELTMRAVASLPSRAAIARDVERRRGKK